MIARVVVFRPCLVVCSQLRRVFECFVWIRNDGMNFHYATEDKRESDPPLSNGKIGY